MSTLLIHTYRPDFFLQGKKSKKSKKTSTKALGKPKKKPARWKSTYQQAEDTRTMFTNEAKNIVKDGKDYLVVPGVPVQEQVMNTYLLPAEEIQKSLESWNGTPLSIRHAKLNGGSVQVEEPDVPIIGEFQNATWDEQTKRMLGEYWIDVTEAMKYAEGQVIMNAIRQGKILETSTAYWADEDYVPGTFKNKTYKTVHRNPKRDHIAIFPDSQVGACSVEDGCGVNRNMRHNCGCGNHTQQNNYDYPDYVSRHLPTAMLIGYALNKGSRTKEQMDTARSFVQKNGIKKPVWVQCYEGKYRILDGNHRVYLAEELGIEQVPVRVVNEDLIELNPEALYRKWLHEQDQGYLS